MHVHVYDMITKTCVKRRQFFNKIWEGKVVPATLAEEVDLRRGLEPNLEHEMEDPM